jgi:hypothetical protein
MKKKLTILISFVALLTAVLFIVTACGDPGGGTSGGGNPGGNPSGDTVLSGTVSIDGNAKYGQPLTANIASLDGDGTPAFQWKRNTGTIPSATGQTYVLTDDDIGKTITVTVSRAGYTGSKTSNPTAVITEYAIGDTGPAGGIIFYVNTDQVFGDDWKYLEAAPADIAETKAWASSSFKGDNIPGTETVAIGSGKTNTATILAEDSLAPAAKACADYGNGTAFDDWFLPSCDELDAMYLKKGFIGGFSGDVYWSSSQNNYYSAWVQQFSNGEKSKDKRKEYTYNVRAVRAF